MPVKMYTTKPYTKQRSKVARTKEKWKHARTCRKPRQQRWNTCKDPHVGSAQLSPAAGEMTVQITRAIRSRFPSRLVFTRRRRFCSPTATPSPLPLPSFCRSAHMLRSSINPQAPPGPLTPAISTTPPSRPLTELSNSVERSKPE